MKSINEYISRINSQQNKKFIVKNAKINCNYSITITKGNEFIFGITGENEKEVQNKVMDKLKGMFVNELC